jgi:hypothetical protein
MGSYDWYDRQCALTPSFQMDPDDGADRHPLQEVKMLDGDSLFTQSKQIPLKNTAVMFQPYIYPATGNYGSALQNGTQVTIPILRDSGHGRFQNVYLQLNVSNGTGAAMQLLPVHHWVQTIQLQSPSGQILQQFSGCTNWVLQAAFEATDQYRYNKRMYNSSDTYGCGPVIASGASNLVYWMPMEHFFYDISNYLPAKGQGDMQLIVTFQPATDTVVSTTGTAGLTLNTLNLYCDVETLRTDELAGTLAGLKRMRTDTVVPWERRMTITLASINTSTLYPISLNAISGDISWGIGLLRKATNGTNILGRDEIAYKPWTTAQIVDSSGLSPLGQIPEPYSFSRNKRMAQLLNGQFALYNPLMVWNFGSDSNAPASMTKMGQKRGCYPMTTHETLYLTTAGAGTSEIITVTNSAGPATGGSFEIQVQTPEATMLTTSLAYNTSAANIKAAIEQLPNFAGQVTVTGNAATSTSFTITYAGLYENKAMNSIGYLISCRNISLVNSSAASCPLTNAVTTPGVDGITQGATYQLDLIFFSSTVVTEEQGGFEVATSAAN